MQKIIEIDLGEFADDELLAEMSLRGYFVEEIKKLQQEPVPDLFKLSEWNIASGAAGKLTSGVDGWKTKNIQRL